MIVIVDTNIIISACLDASSELYSIIVYNSAKIDFVTPELTYSEIMRHRERICAKAEYDVKKFSRNLGLLMDFILILPADELTEVDIRRAHTIAETVDIDDAIFIAFSMALDSLLWTGDKKLISGVRKQGFSNIVSTAELKRIIKGL